MWRRCAESRRLRFRWLAFGAFFAIAPKCFLCLATYFGLGVALGLTGPEICGGVESVAAPWTTALALSGFIAGTIGAVLILRSDRAARS